MDSALVFIIVVLGMFYIMRRVIQAVMLQGISKKAKKQTWAYSAYISPKGL